jgi:hypothetical protein
MVKLGSPSAFGMATARGGRVPTLNLSPALD